jgi:hypothetical protein
MSYKKAASDQLCFVRDDLGSRLGFESGDVISTHMSKSILLPVYSLKYKSLQIIIRDNFCDWKISVNNPYPLGLPSVFIPNDKEKINPIYCEGFDESWVFDTYQNNQARFTTELYIEHAVYALVACLLDNYKKQHEK